MKSYILSFVVCVLGWFIYSKSGGDVDPYVKTLNATYDYIIVGGGTAGAVIAARLSEDPDVSVLLVEAGGPEEGNPNIAVPALAALVERSEENWAYITEPQKHACFAMHEQRSRCPRGKVLGGTGAINYMAYVRGSRHDYDSWAAEGCDGWSYKDVLPYFIKSESVEIEEFKDFEHRGKEGPLHTILAKASPIQELYVKAAQELGYKLKDTNGEDQIGISRMQSNIWKGVRQTTNTAFLKPNLGRSNLHVSVNTMATKIIIENKKATGVDVIKNNRKLRINAAREVIVSAGVINSPQLLILSGVGPRTHLKELGIEVLADLPVGDNLQDHVQVPVPVYLNTSDMTFDSLYQSPWTLLKYLLFGTGPLSVTVAEGTMFTYKENEPKKDAGRAADIQFHWVSSNLFIPKNKDVFDLNYPENVRDWVFTADETKEAVLFLPILLHPKSRGTLRLRSTDAFDYPLIDPNFLENPEDISTLMKGIRIMEKLIETNALRSVGISLDNSSPIFKQCSKHNFRSDAFWECFIKHHTLTNFHDTSTCRMGALNDPTAVVDPTLRVKGIENLRVADGSVMRNIPSGNPKAATIMIGEKAADMIKGVGVSSKRH